MLAALMSSSTTGTTTTTTTTTTLLVLVHVFIATVAGNVTACCTSLAKALPGKVSYPLGLAYIAAQSSYFSQQESGLAPACIVSPTAAADVSTAVKVLAAAYKRSPGSCNFAIRGGGHTPWAGSANINAGITIDMRGMSDVTVSSDRTVASVGAGALWRNVSTTLDAQQLAIAGGRVSDVGVGGLTIGGGVSFFSPRVGFVCDDVKNFQVVLANGSIVNANAQQNADLWLVLKGGTNNFGVVTRFDFNAFSQGDIWGGLILYNYQSITPLAVDAFANFDNATGYDEYASMISISIFQQELGFVGGNHLVYTKPTPWPPVYSTYHAFPKTLDTTRVAPLTSITDELALESPQNGERELYMTTTFRNNRAFLHEVQALWNASAASIKLVTGISYEMSWQSIPPAITGKAASKGGNVLGLDASDGALVNLLLTLAWVSPTDDAQVTQAATNLIQSVDALAKQKGVYFPYKYLNYADKGQQPIQSYGASNVAKLRAASAKYDPAQVFQKAVPGGFKIPAS